MGKQFLQSQGQNGSSQQQNQGNGLNLQNIINHATQHEQQQSGGAGGNQQLFGQVASFLQNKQSNGQVNENVNESQLMSAFHKITGGGSGSNQEIGEAAAVNAIKSHFGSGGQQQGGIDALIGKAMSIAGSTAGKQGGGQQEAMNHASETVMKLMMKHKIKSMLGGDGGSGDVSQLMSLLS